MGRHQRGRSELTLPRRLGRGRVRTVAATSDDTSHGSADSAGNESARHRKDAGVGAQTREPRLGGSVLAEERKKLIELYCGGYAAVAEALLKITPEELAFKPDPERWSVREIVHHLADSEMTAAVRLRLLLAQDRPTIQGYDQDEFARRLYYDRPHEPSLELFRLA